MFLSVLEIHADVRVQRSAWRAESSVGIFLQGVQAAVLMGV